MELICPVEEWPLVTIQTFLRFPLRLSTSPASQMRIKELIIVTLVSSSTLAMANQSGKPPMVPAVRVDIL